VACLMGAFMANIDRKRKDLALLRLLGYARQALLRYVLFQGLVIAVCGFGLGWLLYGAGSLVFDSYLGQALPQGTYVSRLSWGHLLTAASLTGVVIFLIALLGGWRAMRIAPGESLRDA
jgi:putative ABC transport system permease protein